MVRAARAVRAIGMTSLPVSLARIEHGQTKQRLTIRAHGYNKKKNALTPLKEPGVNQTANHDKVLVIIPTYNEAANIQELLDAIWRQVREVHVLVVDDNSRDGTQEIVRSHPNYGHGRLFLLARPGKLGLGTAYIAGFTWALTRGYEIVIEMDADMSHDPAMLPRMIAGMASHAVVVGSRYVPGGGTVNWSPLRKLISRVGGLYARIILGVPVNDLTGGFNAWSRDVLQSIRFDTVRSQGYSFQIELKYRAFKAGYQILEIPIVFVDRRAGQSKMSGRIVFEAIFRVWQMLLGR